MLTKAAHQLGDSPWRVRAQLWLLAVCFFGLGDVVTTSIGLNTAGVSEAGPVTTPLVEQYGINAILVMKFAVFGGGYALWRVIPQPHSVGVPLGLTAVGILATGWNIHVITLAFLT